MPEKVTVREDLQIIQVESYGVLSAKDLKRCLEKVVEIRRERGFTRVFVDASRERTLHDEFTVFEFGADLAKAVLGMKIALVASPELERAGRFLETVAANRGVHLVVFDSEEAALAWLTGKPNQTNADHH